MEYLVLGSLILGVLAGSALGFVAFVRLAPINKRLAQLERELRILRRPAEPAAMADATEHDTQPQENVDTTAQLDAQPEQTTQAQEPPPARRPRRGVRSEPGRFDELIKSITANWMVWLGGVSLGLAGIFLAVYSIEQGLLGPTARIVMGVITGLSLQAAAEYLRRRTGESSNVFAALAAGGSISLFAAILAALHLYEMIGLNTGFVLLTLIAMSTMALALLHGPMLAALGLVGAYVVPILVSSGSGQAFIALVYALIVSCAALLLQRYVYRDWLRWGVIVGALGWWLITLGANDVEGWRNVYLALFGYMLLAVPKLDWRLSQSKLFDDHGYRLSNWLGARDERWLLLTFVALVVAQSLSIFADRTYDNLLITLVPMLLLTIVAARRYEILLFVPSLLLLGNGLAWLLLHTNDADGRLSLQWLPPDQEAPFLLYLGVTALISTLGGLWNYANERYKAYWAAFTTVVPVLLVVVGYLLSDRHADAWALFSIALGLVALIIATSVRRRSSLDELVVWLYFAGQLAISVAAAITFTPDTLTVVLAAQLVSCVVLMRSFSVDLVWLIKVLASVLIVRLTLNPWLLTYPEDVHWTLWTYGGSVAAALLALRLMPTEGSSSIADGRRWLEGAALHLGVLFAWTELRYWLHDGAVFADEFSALEAGLYVALFGAIAIVYFRRSQVSQHLEKLYLLFSRVSGGIALASYALVLFATLISAPWIVREVGDTPILNMGLLFYGLPVLIFGAYYYFGERRYSRLALWSAAGAAFIFVSLQIRHLYSGGISLDVPVSDSEMVTYSVVWLVIAVVVLTRGSLAGNTVIYRSGMALLAVVIAKIFMLDMADLEGLLRVVSFFGLGLALLGLSYLHQRLSRQAEETSEG